MTPRNGHADDVRCQELLPRVSRTFALSIEALPEELRRPVRTAYLLCRVVDTIEDAAGISRERREALFDAFDAAVSADLTLLGPLDLSGAHGVKPDDLQLVAEADAVLRVFRGLAAAQRGAIRPRVLEMSRGMREYCSRPAAPWGGVEISTLDDLERYCYFVAGTVGELLTDLFLDYARLDDPTQRRALKARAVSFGLGLQLVNIVKDVAEDFERGVCFVPRELADQHGVRLERLLDPAQRDAGLAAIGRLTALARQHLRRAREYTELWSSPRGGPVRLFCTVPLALAVATLDEVERQEDTLRPGRAPTVSRETVLDVVRSAMLSSSRDQLAAAAN